MRTIQTARFALSTTALVIALCATRANGQDIDRVRVGDETLKGKIVGMDQQSVTLAKGSSGDAPIPVNTITEVQFAREPAKLTSARMYVSAADYRNALDTLSQIEASEVERPEISDDIAFYKALSVARLAIAGDGDLLAAARELSGFLKESPNNFHYYQAVEALGDVAVAMEKFDAAQRQYAVLAQTPWDDFKLKAHLLEGRALAAQGKHPEAIASYDLAIAIPSDAPAAEALHQAATLAKAVSLAESGDADAAVRIAQDVIAAAEPENSRLHADAYNALGRCYLKADKQKEALLAFLHVDVLYGGYADAHAESLHYLIPIWESIGRPDRARDAKELLADRYPNSRWARP